MHIHNVVALASLLIFTAGASAGAEDSLTPKGLQIELERGPTMEQKRALARRVQAWFGEDALKSGKTAKIEGLTVAFAMEAPGLWLTPEVISNDEKFALLLTRLADTDIYVAAPTLPNGAGMYWKYRLNGSRRKEGNLFGGGRLEVYDYPRDCFTQPDVTHGTVTEQPKFHSKIYADTLHDWWLYVPAQYKADQPVCLMVFQDGGGMRGYVTPVLDNLIAKGQIPAMAAIFINPGYYPDRRIEPGSERSIEYDTLSDKYSRFLIEEILPEAAKFVNIKPDTASRGICGLSSGGICSFTVAWQRPDQFSKVLSWIGSFTDRKSVV